MKRTCKNCTHFNWCKEMIRKSFKHTPCQDHKYNILRPIAIIVWIIIWLMIVISLHAEEVNPYYSEKQCLDIETYIEYNGKLTGVMRESMTDKELKKIDKEIKKRKKVQDMEGIVKTETEVTLRMSEKEAMWLKVLMQNPIGCSPEDEVEEDSEMRKKFFNNLPANKQF